MSLLLDLIAPWWAKLALAGVLLAALYGWHWNDKRQAVNEAVAEAVAKCEAETFRVQRDALALELQSMKANADRQTKAKNEAESKAKINALAAAGARTELERLRSAVASIDASAGKTPDAAISDGAAARELLGQCADRYIDVAEKADRHALDVRLLLDSWPK
jgi:predicted negative regulator of RcsB-dependent stress response